MTLSWQLEHWIRQTFVSMSLREYSRHRPRPAARPLLWVALSTVWSNLFGMSCPIKRHTISRIRSASRRHQLSVLQFPSEGSSLGLMVAGEWARSSSRADLPWSFAPTMTLLAEHKLFSMHLNTPSRARCSVSCLGRTSPFCTSLARVPL